MDDNESSIDKNSLYHEPFNANMYTSAASACPMNDLQRQHVSPDYTGESVNVHCEKSLVLGGESLVGFILKLFVSKLFSSNIFKQCSSSLL